MGKLSISLVRRYLKALTCHVFEPSFTQNIHENLENIRWAGKRCLLWEDLDPDRDNTNREHCEQQNVQNEHNFFSHPASITFVCILYICH